MVKNDYGQNLTYQCDSCSRPYPKWQGKCDGCNEWNTIVEERKNSRSKTTNINKGKTSKLFSEIEIGSISRFTSGFREFDRVCHH